LLGSTSVTTTTGAYVSIPLTLAVSVGAGERVAFYMTTTSTTIENRYHMGTAVGNVAASNSDVTVYEGTGNTYPFASATNPRHWEGRVHYTIPSGGGGGPTTNLTTATNGTSTNDGVMFDVTATNNLRVSRLGVNLNNGGHDIDVYFRRGTHVGFGSSASGWEMIASTTNTSSAGA
jgi:hypothetical protein